MLLFYFALSAHLTLYIFAIPCPLRCLTAHPPPVCASAAMDVDPVDRGARAFSFQSLITSSKLDAQLYPILMKQTTDFSVLKSFLFDKLNVFLADIEKAQIEITHHIQTTAALKPRDDKTIDKVTQVLRNLNAIVGKLTLIKGQFHALIDAIVDYLESLITVRNAIELYFDQTLPVDCTLPTIDAKLHEHQQFRHKIDQEFDALAQHRSKLIDQIDKQEPIDLKQHDINYINSLWTMLHEIFDAKNATFCNALANKRNRQQFKSEFDELFGDFDRLKDGLNDEQSRLARATNEQELLAVSHGQCEAMIAVSARMFFDCD